MAETSSESDVTKGEDEFKGETYTVEFGLIGIDNTKTPPELIQIIKKKVPRNVSIRINFDYKTPANGGKKLTAESLYINETLYMHMPVHTPFDVSKTAFITVLEYAEEMLMCTHVIACFRKDSPKHLWPLLLKTLKYLGFMYVSMKSPLIHLKTPELMYMVYLMNQKSSILSLLE